MRAREREILNRPLTEGEWNFMTEFYPDETGSENDEFDGEDDLGSGSRERRRRRKKRSNSQVRWTDILVHFKIYFSL